MPTADSTEAAALGLLHDGVFSSPRPEAGFGLGHHTSLVSAGLRRAMSGVHAVDDLGCAEVIHGASTDEDPALAVVKAQMEALERYASVVGFDRRSILTSAADLGSLALPPDHIPRHAVDEPGMRSGILTCLTQEDRIRWVRAVRWIDRAPAFVPTVMAFNVPAAYPAEDFWVPISTGTAAHFTIDAAVENGILEVLERDAVALTWLMSRPGRPLETAPLGAYGTEGGVGILAVAVHEAGYQLACWDITSDIGVPTVLSVLRTGKSSVSQVVGAATRRTMRAAATASVLEALQVHAGLSAFIGGLGTLPRKASRCRRVHDGALLMAMPESSVHFDFLAASKHVGSSQDATRLPADVDLTSWLAALGHDVYVVDLTPPEAAASAVSVVRVVIPSLQPLSPVFAGRYLGSRRLRDASEAEPRAFNRPHQLGAVRFNSMPFPLA